MIYHSSQVDIGLLKDKLQESRKTGEPIVIKNSVFALPTWEEVLDAFDKSYHQPFHTPTFKPNKPEEKMYNSIMEDSFFYYTNLHPYSLSIDYIRPVELFIQKIYGKAGGASSIKTNLVNFDPIADPIHLDPGDMAYWHLLGTVEWGFNEVKIKDGHAYLNNTDITNLVLDILTLNENDNMQTLKIRKFLDTLGAEELHKLHPNITYYSAIILEPGDIAIIPDNCWHGYFPLGPRSGMTFRFQ